MDGVSPVHNCNNWLNYICQKPVSIIIASGNVEKSFMLSDVEVIALLRACPPYSIVLLVLLYSLLPDFIFHVTRSVCRVVPVAYFAMPHASSLTLLFTKK